MNNFCPSFGSRAQCIRSRVENSVLCAHKTHAQRCHTLRNSSMGRVWVSMSYSVRMAHVKQAAPPFRHSWLSDSSNNNKQKSTAIVNNSNPASDRQLKGMSINRYQLWKKSSEESPPLKPSSPLISSIITASVLQRLQNTCDWINIALV